MLAANLTSLAEVIPHHGANLVFDNSRLVGILKGSGIKLPRMSLRRFLKLYDSSQLFVQVPREGTYRRSKVTQLHVGSLLSGVLCPSLFWGKRAKRDMLAKHVLTSVENNESAEGNVSAGDTGCIEPDIDELADTKLKRKFAERMSAILRRRKENKQKEQAMTGALNGAAMALSVASGKRAAGINEELASF
jgi:hypothetical protein